MLRDVILLQKRELQNRLNERYIERDYSFPVEASDNMITVITGPRRAGKSFFGVHFLRQMGSFGYVNFDDERLVEVTDYDEILSALNTVYDNPGNIFLDEIQNLDRWELFVNRLQRAGYRLIVTGSNANLLSSELATHLTGRHRPIVLFPFSFSEYLRALRRELTEVEKIEALNQYSQQGGFPELIIKKINLQEYLTNLFNSVLYKDIIKRFRIRSIQGMEDLAYYLFSNVAKEYSYRTLSRVTRCRSPNTVEKYLRHLEEAFLFFSIKRFSFKVREQVASNKKIYCVDNGLVTALGFRLSPDRGRLYENLVAIALKKREENRRSTIFYWKNPQHEEVDFVIKEGLDIVQLIQVCMDLSDPKTRSREVRALIKAGKMLQCNDLLILTDSVEEEEDTEWFGIKSRIQYVPLWKWLLDETA